MCQLTLTDLGSAKLNSMHTFSSLIANTRISHKDGYGVFNGGEVFKTKLQPALTTNLGGILRRTISTRNPVISHVRLSSYLRVAPKDDDSHPFEQESLVLAHNGYLDFKDEKMWEDQRFKNKIDSEIFSILLDDDYKKTKDMVLSLKNTYKLFWGKFAFIIFSKLDGKYYLARGEQAELNSINIYSTYKGNKEKIGIIVNTDSIDLSYAIIQTSNLAQLTLGVELSWDEKIQLLPRNSIFVLKDKEIKEIGVLQQAYKPLPPKQEAKQANFTHGGNGNNAITNMTNSNRGLVVPERDELLNEILNFCWDYNLKLEDIDEIMYWVLGVPMGYSLKQDIQSLKEYVFPALKRIIHKNVGKAWGILIKNSGLTSDALIVKHNLQFPYFLNSIEDIRKLAKQYKEDAETGELDVDGNFTVRE